MRPPTFLMRRIARAATRCVLTLTLAGLPGVAGAAVSPGSVAPNFTKNEVGAPAPAARSLSDYSGKVVVLFLLGYS